MIRNDVPSLRTQSIGDSPLRFLAALLLAVGAVDVVGARTAVASAEERPRPSAVEAAPHPLEPGSPQGIQYLDTLERYLDLMQKFARLAEDPAASGMAGVFGSKDLFAADGDPARAIEFFNAVLPEVKNEAVQRAIRIQLIDLYKKSGQRDKALEQLRILLTSVPAESRVAREPREPRDSRDPQGRPEGR